MNESNSATSMATENPASPPASAGTDSHENLGIMLDIPVTLSMELGRTRMSIRDLLNLKSGSVVELQKMTDEPLDVLVNGTLVARGEAVVVDDKFGIRLTDVVSPMERVKKL
ncbi:MAG TPA: flagellar motor switch protein FliN [Gammaproteobacteria bacterium]|nr:flagellar motor switch protein FliN [Gammaproteobacteria bacterium]